MNDFELTVPNLYSITTVTTHSVNRLRSTVQLHNFIIDSLKTHPRTSYNKETLSGFFSPTNRRIINFSKELYLYIEVFYVTKMTRVINRKKPHSHLRD